MAKICACCGAKISFFDEEYYLPYEEATVCVNCGQMIEPLLKDIKIAVTRDSARKAREKFEEQITASRLSQPVKEIVRKEFSALENQITGSEDVRAPQRARMFQASFPACCRILKDAGNVICGEPAVPMQCLTVSEENQRTVKVVTVVYENYFFRTGSYASLSVVMVWSGMEDEDGTAVITAVGSGGGNGILNISWGAEEDLEAEFWSTLAARNPELIITDYQQRKILGDTEANMPFRCTAFSDEKHSEMGAVEKGRHGSDGRRRIGVLGGSFDPVHLGHVMLGKAAIEEGGLSRLIVMPTYIQPFKQGKRVTDDEHRLVMTRLAFEDVKDAEVSTFEIDRMRVSYTYDTLTALKKQYPQEELYFITGTDSFLIIDQWYKGIDLLENYGFIVSVRPGYREKELNDKIQEYQQKYHTDIFKLCTKMPDISSTQLREKTRKGESLAALVPEKVERYIIEHGLYQGD